MPIITIYRCDRCEKEQSERTQMWYIGIGVNAVDPPVNRSIRDEQLWCRMCVEKMHLLPSVRHDREKEELPPPPTLEDLLTELIERIVEQQS